MKILSIQDISCYGQCSLTVALPILSAYGIETAILPSAVLSTHTYKFKDFTVLDLTSEMDRIIKHWINEGIKFDAIYTGYIGDPRQFDYILELKEKLLNENGLFFVDPAMADNGAMYYGLGDEIVKGMIKICSVADYILPNITEACFLTDTLYQKQDKDYIESLLKKLKAMGAKNVILTGVEENDGSLIGASFYDGFNIVKVLKEKQSVSYHGTGDIFSSIIIANILNNKSMYDTLDDATGFIVDCILKTCSDPSHWYGVKFEEVLRDRNK